MNECDIQLVGGGDNKLIVDDRNDSENQPLDDVDGGGYIAIMLEIIAYFLLEISNHLIF